MQYEDWRITFQSDEAAARSAFKQFQELSKGKCLHQIQEPAPVTAMDALREAEAALEVAMARILKADPGHSICVTSEAKALVAVRAALAAPAAVAVPDEREAFEKWVENPRLWSLAHQGAQWAAWQARAALAATPAAAPVVLPEPWGYLVEGRIFIGRLLPQHVSSMVDAEGFEPTKLYTEQQVRALLATGGQAKAVLTGELIEAVDAWFARNTGLGGCSDKDVAELAAIFAAPQEQADARDAEQERWMGIGKAIERACVDLPAGAEINIHLEKDAGTVTLSDCDGDEQENFPTDEGLAGVVNAAIDAAIAAAKPHEEPAA